MKSCIVVFVRDCTGSRLEIEVATRPLAKSVFLHDIRKGLGPSWRLVKIINNQKPTEDQNG